MVDSGPYEDFAAFHVKIPGFLQPMGVDLHLFKNMQWVWHTLVEASDSYMETFVVGKYQRILVQSPNLVFWNCNCVEEPDKEINKTFLGKNYEWAIFLALGSIWLSLGPLKTLEGACNFCCIKCTQTTYTSFHAESQLLRAKTSASTNQFDITKQTNFWGLQRVFSEKDKIWFEKGFKQLLLQANYCIWLSMNLTSLNFFVTFVLSHFLDSFGMPDRT